MLLDADRFRTVVAATPLVSIDLIVRRADGAILLGERLNRPAQGCWFVPGGRIRKNESLDGLSRLSEGELGRVFSRDRARLLGVYEHFYRDSVFGEQPDTTRGARLPDRTVGARTSSRTAAALSLEHAAADARRRAGASALARLPEALA